MIPPGLTAASLAELATRGPRYTSYPPATEMRPLGPDVVRRELEELPGEVPASLYVHVPFCKRLCWYCGCNVIPTRDVSKGVRYVDTLATEMALLAHALGPGYPLAEIALGGGSPNFLAADSLRTLVRSIERSFAVEDDARRSVELDPREASPLQIDTLAALGFRSLSVGVQDFALAVQDAINRHQSRVQTKWLIDYARAAGFDDVNVDIVYGLPRQSEESFAVTLDTILALAPDRIALFGYAHLPSKLPHQALVERAGRVLDPYERATLLLLGIAKLTSAGYVHVGLDHFARPASRLARAYSGGRLRRTFQGYVEHRSDTVLGVGTSAISTTDTLYWQNHTELAAWEGAIAAQHLPCTRGVRLDRDDQIRRAVIQSLMCNGAVDLAAIEADFELDAATYFAAELGALPDLGGLATYDADARTIETSELGRLLVRNVCMVFDGYQRAAAGALRFSSTI